MLERVTDRLSNIAWQRHLALVSAAIAGELPFLAFTLCCAPHAAVLLQVMQVWGVLALPWEQLLLMALPWLLST